MQPQSLSHSRCAGPVADGLIEGGMPVARVRKLAQATAFLGANSRPCGCSRLRRWAHHCW